MSTKYCGKHDVTGTECWCCEEEELSKDPKKKEAAYRNPEFLRKRGGLDARVAQQSVVLDKLSQLQPEQLEKLLALAGAQGTAPTPPPPAAAAHVIA